MNYPMVQETSVFPEICPNKSGAPITTITSCSLRTIGNCSITRNMTHPRLSGLNPTLGKDFAC